MDEVDDEIQKLSVGKNRLFLSDRNNGSSSRRNYVDETKLCDSTEDKEIILTCSTNALQRQIIYRNDMGFYNKLAPSVPPKPLRKLPNLPEIPQSRVVKQSCEPLYAKRLQSLEITNYGAKIAKHPILLQKQNFYASFENDLPLNTSASFGANNSKVTLDNPDILEHQLEALEHHKKQLEKRGIINIGSRNNSKSVLKHLNMPKLSSTSLLKDVSHSTNNGLETTNCVMYINTIPVKATSFTSAVGTTTKSSIYGNIPSSSKALKNKIYSNLCYDKNEKDQAYTDEENLSVTQVPSLPKNVEPPLNEDNIVHLIHDNSKETLPPLSPVSSSYSELRQATESFKTNYLLKESTLVKRNDHVNKSKSILEYKIPHDHNLMLEFSNMRQLYFNKPSYITSETFDNHNSGNQASSTYDSIYEPINPVPPGRLSSTRSHNFMYPKCEKNLNPSFMPESENIFEKSLSGTLSTLSGFSEGNINSLNSPMYSDGGKVSECVDILNRNAQNSKELQVECLTDFLVKTINPQQDLDHYGLCFKCKEIVIGENSGCTAMDQIYHIACFTCSQCQINLQGKPFYALDFKPFCELDYLQTLEKCSVCMKPILERILRATGKPYHPQCFTCVVCKKSLDGIPFTVDATNQNYCIEDFHKKFAPRCCVCMKPIMPEPGEEETVRVVALDRSFHFECYKCEDCGLLLSSEAEGRGCYPLDDHVLCKGCNANRVQMLSNRIRSTEL